MDSYEIITVLVRAYCLVVVARIAYGQTTRKSHWYWVAVLGLLAIVNVAPAVVFDASATRAGFSAVIVFIGIYLLPYLYQDMDKKWANRAAIAFGLVAFIGLIPRMV